MFFQVGGARQDLARFAQDEHQAPLAKIDLLIETDEVARIDRNHNHADKFALVNNRTGQLDRPFARSPAHDRAADE